MDTEKNNAAIIYDEESPSVGADAQMGHLANQEDHEKSKWQAIRANPYAFGWCLFAVWVTILVSFENQAASTVIGIPEFRKDFGTYFDGNYVLSTKWQAAFSAAPVAA